MGKIVIATNNEHIWFGDKKYVEEQPYTRFCIEQMSDEMFNALYTLSKYPEHVKSMSELLYIILDEKWLSNN